MCGALAVPQFETSAQGRRPGAQQGSHQSSNRGNHNNGGNHSRPNQGNHNQRPDQGRPGSGNHNQRPNPGNHGGNHNQRPNPGNHAPKPNPGGGNNYNPRPNPGHGNHYNPRPNPGYHHPAPPRPPHRPHRPNIFWSHRPAPPPAFRPHYHLTPLQAIIGFAVGTTLNASLSYLYANNYVVDGYADNQLFLRNVSAFNTVWPDAVLTYTNGCLSTGNFSYSTPYYDSTCYNRVFGVLSNTYGAPVSTVRQNNGWSATWWGYDNRYLTLDFRPYYAVDGTLRYYTTLTVG